MIEDENLSKQMYDSSGNNASEDKSNSGPPKIKTNELPPPYASPISMDFDADFDAELCEMETL